MPAIGMIKLAASAIPAAHPAGQNDLLLAPFHCRPRARRKKIPKNGHHSQQAQAENLRRVTLTPKIGIIGDRMPAIGTNFLIAISHDTGGQLRFSRRRWRAHAFCVRIPLPHDRPENGAHAACTHGTAFNIAYLAFEIVATALQHSPELLCRLDNLQHGILHAISDDCREGLLKEWQGRLLHPGVCEGTSSAHLTTTSSPLPREGQAKIATIYDDCTLCLARDFPGALGNL